MLLNYKLYNKKKHGFTRTKNTCNKIITLDTESSNLYVFPDGRVENYDYEKPVEYYEQANKVGIPYIWMLSIETTDNDCIVYYGRELTELKDFLNQIHKDTKGKTICYIHNLGHDFQFLRNIITFDDVFAREPLKPMKAYSKELNMEFRCSYVLTNSSLEEISKRLPDGIEKKVGYLDYNQIRTPNTPLVETELEYCEYDCLVLHFYIVKEREVWETIENIPLTQTGKVRRALIEKIKQHHEEHRTKKYSDRWALKDWKRKVSMMAPNYKTHKLLHDAFSGGYVHANRMWSGEVVENIHSWDFTTSYIYTVLSEKFPMSYFVESDDTIENLDIENKAYLMTVKINGLESMTANNYLSASKMLDTHGGCFDNGRISYADYVVFTCTEQDWITINQAYAWDSVELVELYETKKDYLPIEILSLACELYATKQLYKGVEGAEDIYARAKEMLNAIYGMMVTNNMTDEIIYSKDGWKVVPLTDDEIENKVKEEASDETNLLPFQWGVWVSAYARKNLWKAILEIDSDIVYCDTDSVKFMGNHQSYIDAYNRECEEKITNFIKRNPTFTKPEGLGKFDNDGEYKKFVTLGAKKYCFEYDEEFAEKHSKKNLLYITLSGVKKTGASALNGNIENFRDGFVFDRKSCGTLVHNYNSEQGNETIIDMFGEVYKNEYKFGVCLTPAEYTLGQSSISDDFVKCIRNS